MTKREKRAAKAATRDAGAGRRRGTGGPGPTRGRRDPVPVVLVVAEGEKTEIDYLAWLNRRRREVRIDAYSKFNSPEQVVQHALDRRKRGPADARSLDRGEGYDEVWCFVDVDDHAHLPGAVARAQREGLGIVVSGRCFETWLLMHLRDETRPYSDSAAEKKAWRDLTGGPDRGEQGRLDDLKDGLPEALRRARAKRKQDERNQIPRLQRNPTDVDVFVRSVADLAGVPHEQLYR